MIVAFSRIFILISILIFHSNFALAISGKEISVRVSNWLSSNGISGTPVFSDNRIYNDCNQKLEISKHLNSYKLVRVKCPNDGELDLFVRIKVDDEKRAKSKKSTLDNKKKVKKNSNLSKKEKKVKKKNKVFKLSRAVEKNSVLQEEDIKVLYSDITSQISFFNNENELIEFYKNIRANVQKGYKYSKLEKSRLIWIAKDICALDATYSRFNKSYEKVFTGRGIYMYKKVDEAWKMFSMSGIEMDDKK